MSLKDINDLCLRKSDDPMVNAKRQRKNQRISSKRAPTERPFATLENMNANKVKVTTTKRTKVKILIVCIIHNIKQLITLKRQEKETKKENKDFEEDMDYSLEFFNKIPERIKTQKIIDKIKNRKHKFRKHYKRPKITPKKQKRTNSKKSKINENSNKLINRKFNYSF